MAWGRGQYWSFWGQHQPLPLCETLLPPREGKLWDKYSAHGKAGNEQGVLGEWGWMQGREKNETDKKRYKVRESATEMEMETRRDK